MITQKEYNELKEFKQAFIDLKSINKKNGESYKKYKELKEMNEFFIQRYGEMYKNMVEEYKAHKKYMAE